MKPTLPECVEVENNDNTTSPGRHEVDTVLIDMDMEQDAIHAQAHDTKIPKGKADGVSLLV